MTEKHDESTQGPQDIDLEIGRLLEGKVNKYLEILEGEPVSNLYSLFVDSVEGPFMAAVVKGCKGNQSKAAKILGVNRGTLRTKLEKYQR